MSRDIKSFDYVNYPYEVVRAELQADPAALIRSATSGAKSRAAAVAAELRLAVAGLHVSAPIELQAWSALENRRGPGHGPQLRIPIEWRAAGHPDLFPVMRADLWVYPLTKRETQLDFRGEYDPPLGVLGAAIDAAIGRRVAEACVHRFVTELADHLRQRLSTSSVAA